MPAQAILLFGKEPFLKREFIEDLKKKLFGATENARLNAEEFHAERTHPAAVADFLRTAPFLGDKRLAVYWEVEAVEDEAAEKMLLELTQSLSPSAVLVLVCEQSNLKKNRFVERLSQEAQTVACHPPFEKDIPAWIEARARKLGKPIERKAVPVLIERVGAEVASLHSALEQLGLYAADKPLITADDVQLLLGKSAQDDIFRLADRLFERRRDAALQILQALFKDGAGAPTIVAGLAAQMERLRKCRRLVASGMSPREIAAEFRVPPMHQEKFFAQVRTASDTGLKRAARKLLDCDEAVKTGRMPERAALERFVLEFEPN